MSGVVHRGWELWVLSLATALLCIIGFEEGYELHSTCLSVARMRAGGGLVAPKAYSGWQ